ncbi:CopY/TcrY family copper transport repressor [Streptococcus catagoni]|uniref:CopY/TcrY family copper transport repressor n=1 Tax=Streptococcus catagoni TaxID=2654874 RepID=UPI00140CD4F3|nr:CopY/TcrY family copper transport repressor [Streptococcus catagoni]
MVSISTSEWEVMRVLWANEQIKSTDIVAILKDKYDWSASTVKTLLGRLVDKKLVLTQRAGRAFLYQPLIDQKNCQEQMVKESFARICQCQHNHLLLTLLEDMPMTQADLEAFEQVLRQKKKDLVPRVACNCVPGQCQCQH